MVDSRPPFFYYCNDLAGYAVIRVVHLEIVLRDW